MKQLGIGAWAGESPVKRAKAPKVSKAPKRARESAFYGQIVPCPELACDCGRVRLFQHVRGVYFFYDRELELGDRTVRAPKGPHEGAPYYFADLSVASATLARVSCALHGGPRPSAASAFAKPSPARFSY